MTISREQIEQYRVLLDKHCWADELAMKTIHELCDLALAGLESKEPVAWMRRRVLDPTCTRGRKLKDVTINKCLDDDLPLYAAHAEKEEG